MASDLAPPSPKSPDSASITKTLKSHPKLKNISPAIFVPITEDFAAPLPAVPSATTARIRTAIERHDRHSDAVRANIIKYHRREAHRQTLEASLAGPAPDTTPLKQGLSDQDRARLIANLEAPHEAGRDYNIKPEHIPNPSRDNIHNPAMRQLEQATREYSFYQQHVNQTSQKLHTAWRDAKDREAA
ncbi:hypothetical protein CC79DRAFT_1371102 [Sarocladium strictum]